MLNNKMGGDLKKIQTVGRSVDIVDHEFFCPLTSCFSYMIEVWKSCGMDMNNVTFAWSSEEINQHPDECALGYLAVLQITHNIISGTGRSS